MFQTEIVKDNILAVTLLSEKPVFRLTMINLVSWSFYDLVQHDLVQLFHIVSPSNIAVDWSSRKS